MKLKSPEQSTTLKHIFCKAAQFPLPLGCPGAQFNGRPDFPAGPTNWPFSFFFSFTTIASEVLPFLLKKF